MYGIIKSDDQVFKGDKIRFDVSKSFFDPGETPAATSHEISFDGGSTWLNVTQKLFADTAYSTTGTKTVTLRMTKTAGSPTQQTFTRTVEVLDLATANLFSKDSDLYQYEAEIDAVLPARYSSWNMIHLRAQKYIVDWLDERGYRKASGAKFLAADFLAKDEVNQFSVAVALEMIYASNANIAGDISTIKRDKYAAMKEEKAARFVLTLDIQNNDDAADPNNQANMHTISVTR